MQDAVRLDWPQVGTFTIRGRRTVEIQRAPDVRLEVLRQFLTGPVYAVLLRQGGFLVLHGSAVALKGGAAAFLGASGWGKSTLAAALQERGHVVITDDVAAINMDGSPAVLPSTAHLKLWPDALAALGDDAAWLPRVHPQLEKRVRSTERPPPAEPVPLKRVYVLADAGVLAIERLDPREALVELLRHSYGARTLQHVRREDHFLQCARFAAEIPLARLEFPRSFALLDQVARLVEEDCRHAP